MLSVWLAGAARLPHAAAPVSQWSHLRPNQCVSCESVALSPKHLSIQQF